MSDSPRRRRPRGPRRRGQAPSRFDQLEARDLLARVLPGGAITVRPPDGRAQVVEVFRTTVAGPRVPQAVFAVSVRSGAQTTVSYYARLTNVTYYGGRLGDRFTNRTDVPVRAFGQGGNDTLTGGSGADALYGGNGDDVVRGGAGDDLIGGGPGADALYGEAGLDTFVDAAPGDLVSHGDIRLSVVDKSPYADAEQEAVEDNGIVWIDLGLNERLSVPVTVDYETVPMTALAGEDFVPTHGRLVIPAGQLGASLSIPIVPDATPENDETFAVRLSNASPAGVTLTRDLARVHVHNDDVNEPPYDETFDRRPWIAEPFKVFDFLPRRAHPGVPLDFTFSSYEEHNRTLTWSLEQGPPGMLLQAGSRSAGATVKTQVDPVRLVWTPPAQPGTYQVSVRVTGAAPGESRLLSWTLRVDPSEFLFVSPAGNDANPGTIAQPLRTVREALSRVPTGGTAAQPLTGKTIYLRGGLYDTNTGHGDYSASGRVFAADRPLEVRAYPGESVVVDRGRRYVGFTADGSANVLVSNIEVRNASANDGETSYLAAFGTLGGRDIRFLNVTAHDTQRDGAVNPSGIHISHSAGTVLVDRSNSYHNGDRTRPDGDTNGNYSNFYVTTKVNEAVPTDNPAARIYILNSRSSDSPRGFKVKHAGVQKLILHNDVSVNDGNAFNLGGAYSSVRYSVALNSRHGVYNTADEGPLGPVLVENNTIVNAREGAVNWLGDFNPGSVVRNNLLYQDVDVEKTPGVEEDHWLWEFYPRYDASKIPAIRIENNVYYSAGGPPRVMVWSGPDYRLLTFDEWKRLYEPTARFAKPTFANLAAGDVTPTGADLSAPFAWFVGARRPL